MDFGRSSAFWLALVLCAGPSVADDGLQHARFAVTYTTEPANASLYSSTGNLYGATPLTLYYDLPLPWEACVPLERLSAVWISGVESEVQIDACPENGAHLHHTVARPQGPGLDLDLRFADKVNQLAQRVDAH